MPFFDLFWKHLLSRYFINNFVKMENKSFWMSECSYTILSGYQTHLIACRQKFPNNFLWYDFLTFLLRFFRNKQRRDAVCCREKRSSSQENRARQSWLEVVWRTCVGNCSARTKQLRYMFILAPLLYRCLN